ncbi:hypothetical protein EOM57_05880 [Candidatus Saccharibacteria bacterium]|nr:hypothetical protein [Candidatus Saccharibacteria bacterium]
MGDNWLLYLLGGGAGGTAISALIGKIKGRGERQKDSAEAVVIITNAFEKTLKAVQESAQAAIKVANENFIMSTDREGRLLEIIKADAEYKTRMEAKYAELDKRFMVRGEIINKAADCKFLKNKPNTECPVIKSNVKGLPVERCETCDVKDVHK